MRNKWFQNLSEKRKKAYLKAHPGSRLTKYANAPGGGKSVAPNTTPKALVVGAKPAVGAVSVKPASVSVKPAAKGTSVKPLGVAPPPAPRLVPRPDVMAGGERKREQTPTPAKPAPAKVKGFSGSVANAMRLALKKG